MTTSISDRTQDKIVTVTEDTTASKVALDMNILSELVPHKYDYIALTYTSGNLTKVEYKNGGSGGTLVATLTLAYTGSQLDSVTKT